ncbi:MAG: FAD-binding oxidoreductase [Herpetosiphonaceae bacterium]|nr:FAD-binding oxidoreductase [Herpetosiphonaceae bacterium]
MTQSVLLQAELSALVGAAHASATSSDDMVDGLQPQLIVEPGDVDELSAVLRWANDAGVHVLPRGGGTKQGWGNAPHGGELILSTRRLNQVLEHAWGDMTASAQAGCTVEAFNLRLAEHGQQLALDPLWPNQATIGGVLSVNDSGALRLRYGSLRDLIIGITIVLPDGTIARSGGKVVKNVAGYDLPKLLTGSFGTLGVIVDATFRLYPLPHALRTVTINAPNAALANELLLRVLDSTLVPVSMQLRAGSGRPLQLDICFVGSTAAINVQTEQLARLCLAMGCVAETAADELVPWQAREALWAGDSGAVVCKMSLLPAQQALLVAEVERLTTALRLQWELVTQAVGVGTVRLAGANDQVLMVGLKLLRSWAEAQGGSLVVLAAPTTVKQRIDVWGQAPAALPVMRRVKEHFDPHGILNPGRFVGGI